MGSHLLDSQHAVMEFIFPQLVVCLFTIFFLLNKDPYFVILTALCGKHTLIYT